MQIAVVVPHYGLIDRAREVLLEAFPDERLPVSVSNRKNEMFSKCLWPSGDDLVKIILPGEAMCGIGLDRILVAVPRSMKGHRFTEWVDGLLSMRLYPGGVLERMYASEDEDVVLWIRRNINEVLVRRLRQRVPLVPVALEVHGLQDGSWTPVSESQQALVAGT